MKPILFLTKCALYALIWSSCSSDKRDIRDFYFPLKSLQTPLVYEYQTTDSLPPFYLYVHTLLQGDSVFFTTNTYSSNLVPLKFEREVQTHYGMLLRELFQYYPGDSGKVLQIPTQIVSGNAFPYQVTDDKGIFVYSLEWLHPVDSATRRIVRNRRFGGDTTWIFEQKTYPAIWFHIREMQEYEKNGRTSVEYEGKEIYAKGLGLVFTQHKTQGRDIQYQLKARYNIDSLKIK